MLPGVEIQIFCDPRHRQIRGLEQTDRRLNFSLHDIMIGREACLLFKQSGKLGAGQVYPAGQLLHLIGFFRIPVDLPADFLHI